MPNSIKVDCPEPGCDHKPSVIMFDRHLIEAHAYTPHQAGRAREKMERDLVKREKRENE